MEADISSFYLNIRHWKINKLEYYCDKKSTLNYPSQKNKLNKILHSTLDDTFKISRKKNELHHFTEPHVGVELNDLVAVNGDLFH